MQQALPDRNELTRQARAFYTKKRLGQHFLIDPEALATVAGALEISPGDRVIEVGPGLGFLTQFLLDKQASVIAVELDEHAVERLNNFRWSNLTIVHQDFLRFNLEDAFPAQGKAKVAGNIPYQITSPILRMLFGEIDEPNPALSKISSIVFTIQAEVADRFVAVPGTKQYSQITLLVNNFSMPEIIKRLPSESFIPPPEVESAIVRLIPRQSPAVSPRNPRLMRQIIQAGFRQRRKMLKNNLNFLSVDDSTLDAVFDKLNFDPQTRAERLSLQQFAMLADALDETITPES
jgi:16S rRNA (adenine1518-N6/adenine1519-N6)-dimethyltransferase